jgi:hypothetical protein
VHNDPPARRSGITNGTEIAGRVPISTQANQPTVSPLSYDHKTRAAAMTRSFDPAPHDKHAVDPKEAARLDREASRHLDEGLAGTFPASDPVSATVPPPGKDVPSQSKQQQPGWLGWLRSLFRQA